jgi:hypothetical protein
MSNGYQQVSRDTAAAERGAVPDHPVDGYNLQAAPVTPPTAAKFNQDARDLTELQQAADARREHSRHLSDLGCDGRNPQSPTLIALARIGVIHG